LLEPQRSNLVTFSEQLDNAAWTKLGSSASANQAVSPDGYTNGDKLLPNNGISITIDAGGVFTSGAAAYVRSGALTLTAASYTFSIFVKKAELDYVQLRVATSVDLVNNGSGNLVNLNNGDSSSANSVQDYGNGWYRVSHTFTATAATWYVGIWFWNSTSLTANGSQGILGYGAQLELGAYVTSYIPTLGASVTRVADAASKENIAGTLPTGYPFTLYAQGFLRENNDVLLSINDYAASDVYYQIGATASGFFASTRNTITSSVTTASGRSVGTHKVAAVFTSSEIRLFANGILIATGANTQTFNASANDLLLGQLRVNSDLGLRSSVNEALVFKSALTDAQCIELTA
jgi:hypothetical protein